MASVTFAHASTHRAASAWVTSNNNDDDVFKTRLVSGTRIILHDLRRPAYAPAHPIHGHVLRPWRLVGLLHGLIGRFSRHFFRPATGMRFHA